MDTNERLGGASYEGTEAYSERFPELHPSHFRLAQGLIFSSIGIGTYLGDATDKADSDYETSVKTAVGLGCNVIDTAINYRFQRSERAIGRAVKELLASGYNRSELVLCSKAGFIPFDGSFPADPYEWIDRNLLQTGIVTPEDIHPSGHCMAPMYILYQLKQSLANLAVDKLDVYYVHNPETQIQDLHEVRFYESLEMAFRALESAVHEGMIGNYGIATWDGFLEQRGRQRLMQLERVVDAARRAGGPSHHFRFVQLPVNLEMTDAITATNQTVNGNPMTFLEATQSLGLSVVASASLLQGELANHLPVTVSQAIGNLPGDAARALQFTRSTPGITTALVGMQNPLHVRDNLELASLDIMDPNQYNILFGDR